MKVDVSISNPRYSEVKRPSEYVRLESYANTRDDDAIAGLMAAANSGVGTVDLGTKTYSIKTPFQFPLNVNFRGEGATFDFSGADYDDFSSVSGRCFRTESPVFTEIATGLAADVDVDSRTLTFNSGHGLAAGDVICIYNPTDGSFTGHRTYYRDGEFMTIESVSGDTITVEKSPFVSHDYTAIDVYKVTNLTTARFENFNVIGIGNTANNTEGVRFEGLYKSTVSGLTITNASNASCSISNCYDTKVVNNWFRDDGLNNTSTDYGLVVGNCQQVQISGNSIVASRHGLATGGSGGIGKVPCRLIEMHENFIGTTGTGNAHAANMHGNISHSTYRNNIIDGGLNFGGNHVDVIGNQDRKSVV